MKKAWILGLVFACTLWMGCSSSDSDKTCVGHDDCGSGEYCADSGKCESGCVSDADCQDGTCNLDTHQCESGQDDGGDDGGTDGGTDAGTDGGADQGSDPGSDQGPGDTAGDQDECDPTHDKLMGEACDCDDECVAEAPFCFADVMNDTGPLYCTIPDCTADSCPENYQCNDFYVNADPPQPPFCQKCLGGDPREMGIECLCDSDCAASAPDCFKDLLDGDEPPATCTTVGCTIGEGDQCPGLSECSGSIDMADPNLGVTYCKMCDPGDGSLAVGTECGCNKDCTGHETNEAICTSDSLQDPTVCVACLGGTPRGFGETCACNIDCAEEYPTCLLTNNYCSILGCLDDPNIECPQGSTCTDVYGIFSYCKKD
jgi:hypothetical protein